MGEGRPTNKGVNKMGCTLGCSFKVFHQGDPGQDTGGEHPEGTTEGFPQGAG